MCFSVKSDKDWVQVVNRRVDIGVSRMVIVILVTGTRLPFYVGRVDSYSLDCGLLKLGLS